MSYIQFDRKKCQKDGICAAECPLGLIVTDPATREPRGIDAAAELCIRCGHCVSVCSCDALSLADIPVSTCEPLSDGWQLDQRRAAALLKGRRSVRAYTNATVPRETIEQLLDVARFAPTGINSQPLFWTVVYTPERTHEIARLTIEWMKSMIAESSPLASSLRMSRNVEAWEQGHDRICRNAPHLVIACALSQHPMAPTSADIAITYLDLLAASAGLGACWAGYVNMAINMFPPLKKYVGLGSRESSFGALLLGHPKYHFCRIPSRKPLTVHWQ